jgi:hypothetical protein
VAVSRQHLVLVISGPIGAVPATIWRLSWRGSLRTMAAASASPRWKWTRATT